MNIWKVELRCKIEDSPGPPAYIYWYKVKDTINHWRDIFSMFIASQENEEMSTFSLPFCIYCWKSTPEQLGTILCVCFIKHDFIENWICLFLREPAWSIIRQWRELKCLSRLNRTKQYQPWQLRFEHCSHVIKASL